MGAWSDSYPEDTLPANTLGTIAKTVKQNIMERMRVTNADADDEHLVYDASADGTHPISVVGFAKLHSSKPADGAYPDGSLHVVTTGVDAGLYVYNGGAVVALAISDHGKLAGLSDDDHTLYIRTDGSRAMSTTLRATGNWTVAAFGTDADDPLPSSHHSTEWYSAHGADSLVNRHFVDASIGGLKLYGGVNTPSIVYIDAEDVDESYLYFYPYNYNFWPTVTLGAAGDTDLTLTLKPNFLVGTRIQFSGGGLLWISGFAGASSQGGATVISAASYRSVG